MKKNKIVRMLTAFIMLSLFCSISSYAQEQRVTIKVKNASLKDVFKKIEKQTTYRFSYRDVVVDNRKDITMSKVNASVSSVLDEALKGRDLIYKIVSQKLIAISVLKKIAPTTTSTRKLRVIGVVRDDKGEPIIGASVKLKGKAVGTITDSNGQFSIDANNDDALDISFIGYKEQEVSVDNKQKVNVVLKEEMKTLTEVVVVGYGVQRKRDVSTSISQVKAEDLANLPVSDFRQSLVGKMPGVSIMQPSGDPEGSVTVRVRGVSSATAGNDPLYIIDGVPVDQGLHNLNTNDIESVEVLKDASSAAIYGSRGSNGVILITTKKGKTDKLTVSYDGYYAFDKVSKKIDMMNAYQYAEVSKEAHDACYYDIYPNGTVLNGSRPKTYMNYPTDFEPYLKGEKGLTDTDWQDAIFRTAQSQNHNLSFSGKAGSNSYFISASYLSKEGVIIHSNYKRYSVRLNFDGKYKKLKYGVNFSPSYSKSNRVDASGSYGSEGVVQTALAYCPI
jgi:TonB-linked SusC/RagA family outer membrane protein